MPFTASDAASHNAACKDDPDLCGVWVAAANSAIDDGEEEADAITIANEAVEGEKSKRAASRKKTSTRSKPKGPLGGDGIERRKIDAPLNLGTLNEETREVDMVISTGMSVLRRDWDGCEYNEVLSMDPKAIRMGRLRSGAPILDSHNWFCGLEAMLGSTVPGSVRIEGDELVARARFSRNSELATRAFNDLRDGIKIPLSAGYRIHGFREDRTTTPITRTITDWEPVEVSLVTVPAEESGTGFRRSAPDKRGEPPRREATPAKKERPMDKPRRRHGESDADLKARIATWYKDHEAVENETAEQLGKRVDAYFAELQTAEDAYDSEQRAHAERDRAVADMLKRGTESARDVVGSLTEFLAIGERAGMSIAEIRTATRPGMTTDDFRTVAFEFLAKKTSATKISATQTQDAGAGGGGGYGETRTGDDPQMARNEAMAEALSTRMLARRRLPAIITDAQREWCKAREITDHVGIAMRVIDGKEQPKIAQAREFLDMSIVELAAECINYKPGARRRMLRLDMAEDILHRAYHSTGDFPGLFENALNKSLLARYAVAMPTYREIAIERTFNDFRPHPQVRAGDFPQPTELSETGELKYGTAGESREVVAIKPYGRIFAISRQMMVNDDLGAIDQILGSTGTGILRFENTTFFAMLLQNAGAGPVLLQDTKNVFTFGAITIPPAVAVGHNNYADTFAHLSNVPSITTISAGRQALGGMQTIDGQFLNVQPSIILTGLTNQTAAEQIVTQITPALFTSVNPFQGKLRPIAEAQIQPNAANGGEPWYLFADPQVLPCFVYGFLAGTGGPRVRTDEPFGVQGVRVSLEHDFGVGAIDYRGTYQNIGKTS